MPYETGIKGRVGRFSRVKVLHPYMIEEKQINVCVFLHKWSPFYHPPCEQPNLTISLRQMNAGYSLIDYTKSPDNCSSQDLATGWLTPSDYPWRDYDVHAVVGHR